MSTRVDPLADRLADEPTWRIVGLAAGIVLLTLVAVVLVVAVATASAPVSPLSGRLHQAAVGIPAVLAFYEACRRIASLLRAGHSYGTGPELRWFFAADRGVDEVAAGVADCDVRVDRDEPTTVDLYEHLATVEAG